MIQCDNSGKKAVSERIHGFHSEVYGSALQTGITEITVITDSKTDRQRHSWTDSIGTLVYLP